MVCTRLWIKKSLCKPFYACHPVKTSFISLVSQFNWQRKNLRLLSIVIYKNIRFFMPRLGKKMVRVFGDLYMTLTKHLIWLKLYFDISFSIEFLPSHHTTTHNKFRVKINLWIFFMEHAWCSLTRNYWPHDASHFMQRFRMIFGFQIKNVRISVIKRNLREWFSASSKSI